ncbi:LysR family transcriptional regulator [Taklimakanibacter deserti]|uniref:LysR family transcriptional regulator n=1 Tax=Taklimakanibacter deserti TaxID=2267839 RepID=UPI000E6509EA
MAVNPPRPPLPPLKALRVFEAAARLGGFAAAAEELNVTPGAVAQQIRKLEEWLGVELFRRTAQGVHLPEHGRRIALQISDALDDLAACARALRQLSGPRPLHLAASPAVAQLWLRPRLAGLKAALGGAQISVTAIESPPDLEREMFDAAVFFLGQSEAPHGATVTPIEEDVIAPVCTPAIAAELAAPDDLSRQTLLHDSMWRADWSRWLEVVHGSLSLAESGPVYSLYSMGVDAALAGEGVLMGHLPLVRSLLECGKLVRPFAPSLSLNRNLSLLLPAHAQAASWADALKT